MPWYSFDEIFGHSYSEILTVAPSKPLMIAEYASDERVSSWDTAHAGATKAQWIRDEQSVVKQKYPAIRAMAWFNTDENGWYWRIDSSSSSLSAYKALLRDPYYQATLPR